MAKVLLKVLPLTAAVLFATSCSKDENNDEKSIENQPKNEKVVIPFSVKVNTGNSISKIAYTVKDNDVSQFDVTFTNADEGTEMNIESEGNIEPTTLILVQEGNDFVFKGDITLAEGKTEEDFNNGFDITGSFGEAGTSIVTSTTSLADAMGKCSHQYTSTFSSNDATINLDDNYAYLEVSCATEQTKFQLTIGGSAQDYTPSTTNHKIWIAVPNGTSVTGNMIKSMTVVGGNVYRADRTDVVDLGPSVSVVWTLQNVGSYVAWSDAMAAVTSTYGENSGYRLPTEDELNFLISSASLTYSGTTYTFKTEYGSISLYAGGFKDSANGATNQLDKVGYYWANTSTKAICIDKAIINSVYVGSWSDKYFLVRAVRQLN